MLERTDRDDYKIISTSRPDLSSDPENLENCQNMCKMSLILDNCQLTSTKFSTKVIQPLIGQKTLSEVKSEKKLEA